LDALVALVDRSLVALKTKILEAFGSSNWIAASVLRPNHTSDYRLDCDWRLLFSQSEQSSHWL